MLNTVILMGRATTDIELKLTPSGVAVCNFTLAVDRPKFKDKEKETDFIDIVCWRNTAEFVSRFFGKGTLMAIEGTLQVRSYTDKDGKHRKAVEVVADEVHFAEKKDKPKDEPQVGDEIKFEDVSDEEPLPF